MAGRTAFTASVGSAAFSSSVEDFLVPRRAAASAACASANVSAPSSRARACVVSKRRSASLPAVSRGVK